MGNTRGTVYNNIVTPEKLEKCNPENIQLGKDFLEYLASIDRAKTTCDSYAHDLSIFWCYCLDYLGNKFFVDLSKRDIVKFQNHCLNEYGWSPARIRRVKSTLSSLSNYIEGMLDDEFENYRPIIRKIENPTNVAVREKTVFTPEQLQKLLDYLVENKAYMKACMLSLAMNNGRRKSELPRFKVSYFTDDNIIYGSLYKTPEQIKTKGRGSRGKLLVCYTLAKPFKPYLELWLKEREEKGIDGDWLFPAKDKDGYIDAPISTDTLDSWAESFTNFLGVPFYWHSLRHFFTTQLSEANIPDNVIQDLIGWDSADMCRLYCDTAADAKFGLYFGEDGIKEVERVNLADL